MAVIVITGGCQRIFFAERSSSLRFLGYLCPYRADKVQVVHDDRKAYPNDIL
eukprot:CAMPEP_0197193240 /NCGR_PEP_ID=MMETSP1423-20130617/26769_1 /TAXON_ID=476441 /ORGANISM="Pseudo-nitzschia heimii, Strain UNC1101" /LENGTH=51 /DNA_ID=CAMNT_0042646375 /DNA_START=55 /DNA_END=206 /DNA_ORIENTATION=+